jgi:hypothetical protein
MLDVAKPKVFTSAPRSNAPLTVPKATADILNAAFRTAMASAPAGDGVAAVVAAIAAPPSMATVANTRNFRMDCPFAWSQSTPA